MYILLQFHSSILIMNFTRTKITEVFTVLNLYIAHTIPCTYQHRKLDNLVEYSVPCVTLHSVHARLSHTKIIIFLSLKFDSTLYASIKISSLVHHVQY